MIIMLVLAKKFDFEGIGPIDSNVVVDDDEIESLIIDVVVVR